MKLPVYVLVVISLLLSSLPALALMPGDRVDNFQLLDPVVNHR